APGLGELGEGADGLLPVLVVELLHGLLVELALMLARLLALLARALRGLASRLGPRPSRFLLGLPLLRAGGLARLALGGLGGARPGLPARSSPRERRALPPPAASTAPTAS